MSLPVEVSFGNPNPTFNPLTWADAVANLRTLVTAVVTGSYVPYIQGAATPAVNDQDKVWHKKDNLGRPLGSFVFYDGAWRRQYIAALGQISLFSGNPSPGFDGTGRGVAGGDLDGWALCNGQNGTPNLSDKFVVAASMDNVGSPGWNGSVWQTDINGAPLQIGGQTQITLDASNTYRAPVPEINVGKQMADGNTPAANGPLYGNGTGLILQAADAGNTAPNPFQILPPYFALAYMKFVGYE